MQRNILKPIIFVVIALIITIILLNWGRVFYSQLNTCDVNLGFKLVTIDEKPEICRSGNTINFLVENGNNLPIQKLRVLVIHESGQTRVREFEKSYIPQLDTFNGKFPILEDEVSEVRIIPFIMEKNRVFACSKNTIFVKKIRPCS